MSTKELKAVCTSLIEGELPQHSVIMCIEKNDQLFDTFVALRDLAQKVSPFTVDIFSDDLVTQHQIQDYYKCWDLFVLVDQNWFPWHFKQGNTLFLAPEYAYDYVGIIRSASGTFDKAPVQFEKQALSPRSILSPQGYWSSDPSTVINAQRRVIGELTQKAKLITGRESTYGALIPDLVELMQQDIEHAHNAYPDELCYVSAVRQAGFTVQMYFKNALEATGNSDDLRCLRMLMKTQQRDFMYRIQR